MEGGDEEGRRGRYDAHDFDNRKLLTHALDEGGTHRKRCRLVIQDGTRSIRRRGIKVSGLVCGICGQYAEHLGG